MNISMKQIRAIGLCAFVALTACGRLAIHVEDPMALPAQASQDAAVYFVLQNSTLSDDWLLGASTPVATSVVIHRSALIEEEDQEVIEEKGGEYNYTSSAEEEEAKSALAAEEVQMEMAALDSMWIAAGREVEFEPAYYHLMLIGLRLDLNPGDQFPLTLHFKNYGDMEVVVSIEAPE